jgi:hypothetical protein
VPEQEPRLPGVLVTDPAEDLDFRTTRILKREIAEAIEHFERDFYILSEPEMRGVWLGKTRKLTENVIRMNVNPRMRAAIDTQFEKHPPLYEFTRRFFYGGAVLDPVTMKIVPSADHFLWDPLHKERVLKALEHYLLAAPDPYKMGIALFLARGALKTYLMVATACWILVRHKVAFSDYLCIRFIHDVLDMAIERTDQMKQLFSQNSDFRSVYPDCAIPVTSKMWGSKDYWDLPGRVEDASKTLDPQVRALGMGSVKQGSHPHVSFIDDVENEMHMDSPASRRECMKFFGALQFSTQLGVSKNILSGTFYTRLGVHAQVMEMAAEISPSGEKQKSLWDVVHIPCAYDWDDPEKTVMTYPNRQPREVIEGILERDRRLHGDDLFARMQMFLDFNVSGKVEFDMTLFQQVNLNKPNGPFQVQLVEALRSAPCYIQIDSAWKDPMSAGRGDKTCILAVLYPRIDGTVHRFVAEGVYDNTLSLDSGCEIALEMASGYDAWGILVEEPGQKTNGPTLARIAKERGLRYYQRIPRLGSGASEGNIISITPKSTGGASIGRMSGWKMARFKKLQSQWNAGMIWFSEDIPVLDAFHQEASDFPFGRNDDFLDCLALSDDERVQAKLPQPRIKRVKRREITPQVQQVQLTRYTGLTDNTIPRRRTI